MSALRKYLGATVLGLAPPVLAADGAGIDEHAKWKKEAHARTREHAAWKEDRERAQAAIAKLQSLVTDHEKALAEHEVELAAHAREIEAHGAALTRLSPLLVLANAVLGESERFPVELRCRAARAQMGGATAAPPRPPTAASERWRNMSLTSNEGDPGALAKAHREATAEHAKARAAHVEHAAFHRSIMHVVREVETIEHTMTALGLWCDGFPIDAGPETRR
jgi:hypothetical protein